MPGLFDRIKDTTQYSGLLSVGTSFVVDNTPSPVYQSFRSRYAINDANIPVAVVGQATNNWMVCWCTYTALDTLRVDQIIFTSNTVTPDAAVSFSGTSDVFVTASSRAVAALREVNTFTANNYFNGGNVGIGITTPFKPLHVAVPGTGTIDNGLIPGVRFDSTDLTQDGAVGIVLGACDPGGTQRHAAIIVAGKDGTWVTGSNYPGNLQFWTRPNSTANQLERMRIDSSGNVSFTSVGQRFLAEFNDATVSNRLYFQTRNANQFTSIGCMPSGTGTFSGWVALGSSDPSNTAFAVIRADTGEASVRANSVGSVSPPPLTFHTGAAERVRIDTLGNVGIGTSAPSSPLHVVSAANFQPQIIADHVAGAGTGSAYFMLDRARGTPSAKTAVVSGDALGTLMARGYDGSAQQNSAWLSFDVDGTVSAGNVPTGMTFFTTPVGGSAAARMHVDADGNVGIGTTGPSAPLHLERNQASETSLFISNTNASGYSALRIGPSDRGTNLDMLIYSSTNASGIRAGSRPLLFESGNGTERMRMDVNGNFGIGTGNPSGYDAKLAVFNGNIALTTTTNRLYLYYASATNHAFLSAAVGGEITFSNGTASPSEKMRIDTSGNVGIGIGATAPFCRLHVRNDAAGAAPATSGTVDAATLHRIHNNIVALDTGVMANGNIWLQGRNTGDFTTSYPILLNPNPGTGVTGALGFGTTAPRSIVHFTSATAGQYFLFQNTSGAGGTALTSTDTYPITSGNGFIGYGGLFLLPGRWGNATTVDSHNVLYLSGAQRNTAAISSDVVFANWGYFTGTTTAAGHLGNATAQADAVKFNIRHTDNGGEFNQRLTFLARSATGTTVNALQIFSSGETVLPVVGQTDVNSVGFRGSPNNDRSSAYTIALTDAGRTVRKGGTTAFLVSVPADSAVNFPIGSCIILCNAEPTSGNLTVQSTNTTTAIVYRNGTGRDARTSANAAYAIAPGGSAMIRKVKADMWTITGSGIT